MKSTGPTQSTEQQLRKLNEALLISSVPQHELTEQAQQAETALRESQDQMRRNAETFSKFVDHAPFGIYVVDAEFRISQVNDGAQPAFRNVRPLIGRDSARPCTSSGRKRSPTRSSTSSAARWKPASRTWRRA